MIKKAALPDRRCPCQRNMFRESLFQHSHPWAELKIVGSADEKMNVIGHDHISTHSNVMPRICLRRERHKCGMHCVGCEQFPPLVRAEGDEEQRVMSENPPQARREFWIFAHAKSCSRFPVGSATQMTFQSPRRPQGDGYRSRIRCSLERGMRPPGRQAYTFKREKRLNNEAMNVRIRRFGGLARAVSAQRVCGLLG